MVHMRPGEPRNRGYRSMTRKPNKYSTSILPKLGSPPVHHCARPRAVFAKAFNRAQLKTGIVVKPQILREWFCNELGKLGVPDRFVDALCGRLPRSVLARRYSDYSPTASRRSTTKPA